MALVLTIGGAGSGKSEVAEALCAGCGGNLVYVATMKAAGREATARVDKHRALREGKGFATVECVSGLEHLELPHSDAILLECLGNLVANEFFDEHQSVEEAKAAILRGIAHLSEHCDDLVIVANDVFADGVSYEPQTQAYVNLLAEITAIIAEQANAVFEVVCGIPIPLKQGVAHA